MVLGLLRDVLPVAMMVWAPVAPAVAAVGMFPLQVTVPLAAATVLQMVTLVDEAGPVFYVTVMASAEVNAAPETVTAIPGAPGDGDTWTNARVVIRPMELLPESVNHKAPSGPAVIPNGSSMPMPVKLVTIPAVLIRPIELSLVKMFRAVVFRGGLWRISRSS